MPDKDNKYKLVIGVDFGTTYSGAAWAAVSRPEETRVIQTWPNRNNTSEKVPTELEYPQEEHKDKASTSGNQPSTKLKWGFDVPNDSPRRLYWIKLLLEDPEMLEKYKTNLYWSTGSTGSELNKTRAIIPKGKDPVDLVTDYLRALREHIERTFKLHFGNEFLDPKFTSIEYLLTVPAMWSEKAKSLTLQAAEGAGFGDRSKIKLISEPEAGAIYTLKNISGLKVAVGDIYVVADCGGGTVDLISYQVCKVDPSLELKEVVPGSGGMCGSTYLNRRFEEFLGNKLGPKVFNNLKPLSKSRIMNSFDADLKKNFRHVRRSGSTESDDSSGEGTYYCPMPGVANNRKGVNSGFMKLLYEDMRDIFDPIITKISELVQEQVDSARKASRKNVKAVLLVGGFGANIYLREHLQNNIHNSKGDSVMILQPPDAWSAIARGAVLCGLDSDRKIVCSRKAARNYGTPMTKQFKKGVDKEEYKFRCRYTGKLRCSNKIEWVIYRVSTVLKLREDVQGG